jgi:hypothetical protein
MDVTRWASAVRRLLPASAAVMFALTGASAQAPDARRQTPNGVAETRTSAATNPLQIYLVTIGEGEAYWEKFGHNALWFRDPSTGLDAVFNWGTFDFTAPDFLQRQIIGDPQYSVSVVPGPSFLAFYEQYDRTITLQRLNFTPAQARKALDYASWNAREENKYYRYDYFRDNCSTRVRDLIDMASGGALKAASQGIVKRTYRTETLRLLDDMHVTQFGVNVALGEPADRLLTLWDDMFVPGRVMETVRETRIAGADGALVPLVADERVEYRTRRHEERMDFPRLWLGYLIVGVLLAVELFGVGIAGIRSPAAEKVWRVEVAIYAILTGLLGLIVLLGWVITQHVFWYRNENLLLLNPLQLFTGGLLIASLFRERWLRQAAICAIVAALCSAVALIIKGIPGTQNNIALICMFLLPNFAIAYHLWRRAPHWRPAGIVEQRLPTTS